MHQKYNLNNITLIFKCIHTNIHMYVFFFSLIIINYRKYFIMYQILIINKFSPFSHTKHKLFIFYFPS